MPVYESQQHLAALAVEVRIHGNLAEEILYLG